MLNIDYKKQHYFKSIENQLSIPIKKNKYKNH